MPREATRKPPRRAPARREGPWTPSERALFEALTVPSQIQAFLDALPYSADPYARCPRRVLADRKAHCYDGALFAATALRRLGHPPLLLDLRAVRDDDHVLALFRRRGHWGAVAKSNFVGLRFREPIFRTLRELALSYFEVYFNELGEKTLRSYSMPVDLSRYDRLEWMTQDENLDELSSHLDRARHVALVSQRMIDELVPVDPRSLEAGMVGTNRAGLYKGV